MYIRFVVGTNRDCPTTQAGVVTELRFLRDSGSLPDYEVEHVNEIFECLNEVLPCPPFLGSDWPPDAISWFKDSAQDMIRTFREIVALLEEYGRPVRTIVTDKPGMILYEDAFQVVAESEHF
jgi:hypothetical protein